MHVLLFMRVASVYNNIGMINGFQRVRALYVHTGPCMLMPV